MRAMTWQAVRAVAAACVGGRRGNEAAGRVRVGRGAVRRGGIARGVCEALEGRAMFATYNWIDTFGGNFNDPNGWSPVGVPGVGDDAIIAAPGPYTVTLTSDVTIGTLSVGGGSPGVVFKVDGAALSVASSTSITANGALVLTNGAAFNGAAPGNSGVVELAGASFNSTLVNNSTGTVFVGAGTNTIGGVLANQGGLVRLMAGTAGAVSLAISGSLFNNSGGTVELTSDAAAGVTLAASAISNAPGTMLAVLPGSGGARVVGGGGTLTNNGTVNVSAAATITGFVNQALGTLNVAAPLIVPGSLINDGVVELRQGAALTVTGAGIGNGPDGFIAVTPGTGGPATVQAELSNSGAVVVGREVNWTYAGSFSNGAGAILDLTDASANLATVSGGFVNEGLIGIGNLKTLTVKGGSFTQQGTGQIVGELIAATGFGGDAATGTAGALILEGVVGTFAGFNPGADVRLSGSSVGGTGTFTLSAGRVLEVTGSNVTLAVSNAGTIVVEGDTTFAGGLTNAAGGLVDLKSYASTAVAAVLTAPNVTNNGTIRFNTGDPMFGAAIDVSGGGGTVQNNAGGVIDVFLGAGGGHVIVGGLSNAGLVRTGGDLSVEVGLAGFFNNATVEVEHGTLSVSRTGGVGDATNFGLIDVDAGATFASDGIPFNNNVSAVLAGMGTKSFRGGPVNLNTGGFMVSGAVQFFDGSVVSGNGPITVPAGATVEVQDSSVFVDLINNTGGTVTISDATGGVSLGVLANSGSVVLDLTAGNLFLTVNGAFRNFIGGTIATSGSGVAGSVDLSPGGMLNEGTFTVGAGAALTLSAGTSVNTGTIDASGMLTLISGSLESLSANGGALAGTGSIGLAPGASAALGGNYPGTVLNDGVLSVGRGGLALADYVQGASGTLQLKIGDDGDGGFEITQLGVADAITIAGGLSVTAADGYVPMVGDQFAAVSAAGGIVGFFGSESLPGGAGIDSIVEYNPNTVVVAFEADEPVAPNLVATSVTATSASVAAGGTLAYDFAFANDGNGDAGAYDQTFVLSSDAVYGNLDDVVLGSTRQGGLMAMTTGGGSGTILVPSNLAPGQYYLFMVLDTQDEVSETDEDDNVIGDPATFTVTAAVALPDFTIASPNFAVGTYGQGGAYQPALAIRNGGGVTFNGTVGVRIVFSGDTLLGNNDDVFVYGAGLSFPSGLAPGVTTSPLTPNVTLPAGIAPGTYRVFFVVDDGNAVAESNESNNATMAAGTVTITPRANLVAQSISVPTGTYVAGGPVTYNFGFANQGAAGAGTFDRRVVLSTDTIIGNGDDVVLSTVTVTNGLGAATGAGGQELAALPVGLANGTYYLGLVVDSGGAVTESVETDNTVRTATPFMVGGGVVVIPQADLTVTDVVVQPGSPVRPGEGIGLTATVNNFSNSAAGAFVVRFVASVDGVFGNGDDVVLADVNVPAGLGAGASAGVAFPGNVPAGLAGGSYRVLARADAGNAVAESNENNNVGTAGGFLVVDAAPRATLTAAGPVTSPGALFYDFTVTYADDGAIDVSTFGNANVRVTGPNGFNQLATLRPGSAVRNGRTRSATYRITPAGGAFDAGDNGTYTISIEPDQVKDTTGTAVPAGVIGSFTVDTVAGTRDVVLGAVSFATGTFSAGSTIAFGLTLSEVGTQPSGAFAAEVRLSRDTIFGNEDDVVLGRVSDLNLLSGESRVETAPLTIPLLTPAGSYFVMVKVDADGAVAETDETNNAFVSGEAGITVLTPDLAHPASGTPPVAVLGGPDYSFTLRFPAQLSAEGLSSFRARVVGPRNYEQVATLTGVTFDPVLGTSTATYAITAPFGLWASDQNGNYSVFFETVPGAVEAAAGFSNLVGSVTVAVPFSTRIRGEIAQGKSNDTFVDGQNRLHIAYYDDVERELKFALRNPNGTFARMETIDTGDFRDVALTVDNKGIPHVAYYDVANGDLKFARRGAKGGWTIVNVDADGDVGQHPSITLDRDGRAAISYYDAGNGDLKVATLTNAKNLTFTRAVLDSEGDVGRYSSIVLNPQDKRLFVAYTDTAEGTINYADQNKQRRWRVDTIDSGVGQVSLAFGRDKLPAVSYYDGTNGDLKFANFDGENWNPTIVASAGNVGEYNRLFYNTATRRFDLFAYDRTKDAVTKYTGGPTTFTATTLFNGGGEFLSVTTRNGVYGIVGRMTAFDTLVFLTH